MLVLALAAVLAAAPPNTVVAVVDVSASDAIYEDVSRGLTEEVVAALKGEGFVASRIDENQLPEAGCRGGPCLEKVAREQHADVVVVVDALEDKNVNKVSVMALYGRDGRPLAAKRYVSGRKSKKVLKDFANQLIRALPESARDAGRATPLE